MASGTAASVKLCATGLRRPRVLTLKIELMSACVQVFGRRNDGLSTHSEGRRPKAPRQEIAGWERRWYRNYGDFAAGPGVDVADRGGKVRNFATRHGRELGCERVTDRPSNAILRF
jgi:hypothetical protein